MRLHPDDVSAIVNQLFDRLMEEKARKEAAKRDRKPRQAKGDGYTEARGFPLDRRIGRGENLSP